MKILEITSDSNPFFRKMKSLHTSKGIKDEKAALISGSKIIPEILSDSTLLSQVQELIFDEPLKELALELAQSFSLTRLTLLSRPLFKELDEMGTGYPLLSLGANPLKPFEKSWPGLNVFLALSDPLNLGAALRSLDAFGVSQVVLLKECAHPFLPKVTKTSSGSNWRCHLTHGPSLKDLTLHEGVGLDAHGTPLNDFKWSKDVNLVLGEEGKGLPEHLKKSLKIVSIPTNPRVESLNATVALSIAAYSYSTSSPKPHT